MSNPERYELKSAEQNLVDVLSKYTLDHDVIASPRFRADVKQAMDRYNEARLELGMEAVEIEFEAFNDFKSN